MEECMKKLLVLGLALTCAVANAQYVLTNDLKKDFPAESYKTKKPIQVGYTIIYSNTFEPDENTEIFPERDKNGLYVDSFIKLKTLPSKNFPETSPTVFDDLGKILKINEKEIVQKFKAVSKKQPYSCVVTGQMNAQFTLDYDGRDQFRFPHSVSSEIKSATPIGTPKVTCRKQ